MIETNKIMSASNLYFRLERLRTSLYENKQLIKKERAELVDKMNEIFEILSDATYKNELSVSRSHEIYAVWSKAEKNTRFLTSYTGMRETLLEEINCIKSEISCPNR